MTQRRNFNKEYKLEIIKLVTDQGKSVSSVARDLGIHENTIHGWIRSNRLDKDQTFPGKGNLKPEDEENRRLLRELADLREENAILKKAMAIFTNPRK
jgi:transposase